MGGGERDKREQTRETEKKGEGVGWVALCFLSKLVLRSGQTCCQPSLELPASVSHYAVSGFMMVT